MKKWFVIGISIIAAILLTLTSLTNVIGYQTVHTTYQQTKKETVNQRELLFQSIYDIANNKEIQGILIKSQGTQDIFPTLEDTVLTKNRLKQLYGFGLVLSKTVSASRLYAMVQQHQIMSSEMEEELSEILRKNTTLANELSLLQILGCPCNEEEGRLWHFPVICTLLLPFYALAMFMTIVGVIHNNDFFYNLGVMIGTAVENIAIPLDCRWTHNQDNYFPNYSDVSPPDGAQNVSLSLTEISFRLTDREGDLMSYEVTTNPDIGGGSATLIPNGTYTIPIHGLQNLTTYSWQLYYYQGDTSGTPMGQKFYFTTESVAPLIRNPSPGQNAQFVPITTSNLSVDLKDYQGDLMNWTVETQPDIGSGSGTYVGNGTYTVPINGLEYFTTYIWFVNVTDGRYWAKKAFTFWTTTENTIVFEPIDDATIDELYINQNSGSSDTISIRRYSGLELDGLMKFNLSTLPANVTIQYASLQMYYYHDLIENPGGHQLNAYRIMSDWNEETVTWNTRPSYNLTLSTSIIMPSTINTWIFWNLTGDAQLFYYGHAPNYRWRMMDSSWAYAGSCFYSKEYKDYHPLLTIGYKII
jgi:hypothetical protein